MRSRGKWAPLAGVTLLLAMVELDVEAEVAGPRSIVLRVGEQKSAPTGSDSITLLVTVDQASLLAQARRDGTLSLVLRNKDDLEVNEGLAETDDSDVFEQEKRARRQRRLRIEKVN